MQSKNREAILKIAVAAVVGLWLLDLLAIDAVLRELENAKRADHASIGTK